MLRNHTSTLSYTSAPDPSTGYHDSCDNPVAAKRQSQRQRARAHDIERLLFERTHASVRRTIHHLTAQGASMRRIRSRVAVVERGIAHCRRHKTDLFDIRELGCAKRDAARAIARDLTGILDHKGKAHFQVAGSEVRISNVYSCPAEQQKLYAAFAAAERARKLRKAMDNKKPAARAARKAWQANRAKVRRDLIEQKWRERMARMATLPSKRGAHLRKNGCDLIVGVPCRNADLIDRTESYGRKIDKPTVSIDPPRPLSIPDPIFNRPSPKGAAATALLPDQPSTPQPTPIERGSAVTDSHASSKPSEPRGLVAASDDAFGDGQLHNFSKEKACSGRADWLSAAELDELGPGAKEAWAPFTSRDPATRRRIAARIRTTYGNVPTAPPTPPGAAPTPKDGRPTELTAMQQAESEAWIAKMCGITKQSATANAPASSADLYKPGHLLVEVAGRDEYLSWQQLDRDGIGSQFVAFAAVQLERKLQKREAVGNRASWLYSRAKMYAHEGVKDAGLIANPYPYESDDFAAATLAPKFNLYEGVGRRRWR